MNWRLLVVLVLLFGLTVSASAQEDAGDFEDIYAEVPTVRGDDGAFIIGAEDAPVTVIEFADFLCPACQDYHEIMQEFIETYVLTGQAKLEYRFFLVIDPVLSVLAAGVSECAYEQGAFWTVHDEIYRLATAREIGEDLVSVVAANVGLDEAMLDACVATAVQFQIDMAYGEALSVSATPSIRVQVGDDEEAGVIEANGQTFASGGTPLAVLGEFVTSETPEAFVSLANRILRDDLLVDTSLIDEEACEAPCWQGIIPGETTFEEAVAIVEALDGVEEVEVQEIDAGSFIALFGGEVLCCQIFSEDGESVSTVVLNSAPVVSIGEVIARYGEPDYSDAASVSPRQTVHNLWFVDYAMVVFVFTPGEDAALSEESEVVGAVYVESDLYTEIFNDNLSFGVLYEWTGYVSLAELRERDS